MKALAWIWFAIIGLFGLVAVTEGAFLAALILAIAMALSFPPLWARLRERGVATMKPLRVTLSILLLPVGIGAAMANPSAETQARMDADRLTGKHCLTYGGQHADFVDFVKRNLRNPDSFEHISTSIEPKDSEGQHALSMRYRAENGFGGMNVEQISAEIDNSDCSFRLTAS